MTLTMAAHITFGAAHGRPAFDMRRISSIHTESSWKEFTNRAEIVLPRNIKDFQKYKIGEVFQVGDPVIIRLGYGEGDLPVEFEGYLSDIAEGVPVTLKAENEMFNLKRGSVSVSKPKITLKELLQAIAPGYTIDCPDIQLGAVRYSNVAPIKVLEDIKKEAGISTYFDGKTLRSGIIYSDQSDTDPVKIILEKNAVSENLNKKSSASEKVTIRAISLLKNGKKIQVEVGDKGGSSIQRTYIGIEVEAELKKQAEQDLKRYKVEGFDGTVTLFGIPRVEHGMKMQMESIFYENMNGTYFIDKVEKEFDRDGYRQVCTLGNKAV